MTPSSKSLANAILVWSILYHATLSRSICISVKHLSSSSFYIIPNIDPNDQRHVNYKVQVAPPRSYFK